jgi:hypothetical protein
MHVSAILRRQKQSIPQLQIQPIWTRLYYHFSNICFIASIIENPPNNQLSLCLPHSVYTFILLWCECLFVMVPRSSPVGAGIAECCECRFWHATSSGAPLIDLWESLKCRDEFDGSGSLSDLWEDCRGSNCFVDDSLRRRGRPGAESDGIGKWDGFPEFDGVEGVELDDVEDCAIKGRIAKGCLIVTTASRWRWVLVHKDPKVYWSRTDQHRLRNCWQQNALSNVQSIAVCDAFRKVCGWRRSKRH